MTFGGMEVVAFKKIIWHLNIVFCIETQIWLAFRLDMAGHAVKCISHFTLIKNCYIANCYTMISIIIIDIIAFFIIM